MQGEARKNDGYDEPQAIEPEYNEGRGGTDEVRAVIGYADGKLEMLANDEVTER